MRGSANGPNSPREISAGFVESVPYYDEVQLAEMPVTAFELNPAYVSELRQALYRR